ncbi:MAG: DUF5615 family PIN-like protein [bacterium]
MKFKIDENLPLAICRVFRDAGHDALTVLDERLGGYPDRDIAAVCKRESRVLVTLDTDFCNILIYPPREFSGIIVFRTDDQSNPIVFAYSHRVLSALAVESPLGKLWIVDRQRIRVRD